MNLTQNTCNDMIISIITNVIAEFKTVMLYIALHPLQPLRCKDVQASGIKVLFLKLQSCFYVLDCPGLTC